jgi:hypothetical protein
MKQLYYVWIGDTFRSVLYDNYTEAYNRYIGLVNEGFNNARIEEVL